MSNLPFVLLNLILKGSAKSGNRGHAGIPGHVGGSQEKLTNSRTGFRDNWQSYMNDNLGEGYKRENLIDSTLPPFYGVYPSRTVSVGSPAHPESLLKIQKQVDFLDDLSQDELLDFAKNYIDRRKVYANPSEMDMITSRLNEQGSRELIAHYSRDAEMYFNVEADANEGVETEYGISLAQYEKDWMKNNPSNKYGYMDDPTWEKMRQTHGELVSQGKNDPYQIKAENVIPMLLSTVNNAETDSLRRELADIVTSNEGIQRRYPYELRNGNGRIVRNKHGNVSPFVLFPSIASDDFDTNKEFFIKSWLYNSDLEGNQLLHASIASEFNGKNETTGYWNVASLGINYRNPDPLFKQAARQIYNETQDYYTNVKPKKQIKLKRGVTSEVVVSSNIESWSTSQKTAEIFDGHAVYEDTFPKEAIFWSYESIGEPLWNESDLKGKKEYTILPYMKKK